MASVWAAARRMGARAEDGDADQRGVVGQAVEFRALYLEVPSLVADVLPTKSCRMISADVSAGAKGRGLPP
jgi:hypothetical protein